jgi:hypothetical protein
MLASSLNDVGSDIYYFLKLLYNFLMDLMNFNVAVGHSTGAVAATAATAATAASTASTTAATTTSVPSQK